MYNANIKTIPHPDQRYDTLGDYYTEGGVIQFRVSSLANNDYEFLIALHELIEKQLAKKMGITEQMIDAWDLTHEDEEEPGALEGCPYRDAHMIAEGIERVVATKLGVDWDHYEKTCREVIAMHLPPEDLTQPEKPRPGLGRREKIPTGKVRQRSVLRGR